MPTQQTTSTQAAALGYAPQNKVSVLCDGSVIWVDESGASTNTNKLYQIASPAAGSPSSAQVTGFVSTIASATQSVSDIFVVNNGTTTSDVWILTGGQAGAAGVNIQHGVYTASGSSWAWDTSTAVSGVSTTTGNIVSVVWTGTYLIAAWRDVASAVFSIHLNYTTTKNGTTGWQASSIKLNGDAGSASHHYIQLFYDSTLAATVAVMAQETGANGTEFITSRVLSDAFTPALANWGPETSAGLTGLNFGSANFTSTIDHTTGKVHVAWCDSTASNTKSPGYIPATITVDAVTVANNKLTWGTAIAVGTATTAAAQPSLTIDGAGTVYLFWQTAAVNATGNISYATIASPYTSASSVTNLTSSGANYYPHVPNRQRVTAGYIPLIYQTGTASAYGIQYDNSITASTGTITRSAPASAAFQATLSRSAPTSAAFQATLSRSAPASASFSGGLSRSAPASAAFQATVSCSAPTTAAFQSTPSRSAPVSASFSSGSAGTGIGGITVTTGTQTWNTTGNGYGTGDATGTETDYIYKDATNSGWGHGALPGYTLGTISLYEINNNSPSSLPQQTDGTATGSQTTLLTTRHGSIVHWGDTNASGGLFTASEDVTSLTGGNFTELAPSGTDFRRYIKQIGDTVSNVVTNGLAWTVQTCMYPGNPGFMVVRLDMTNPSGSTINLSEQEIQIIASLLPDTGTNPTGKWNASNGFYGTVGGTTTSGWGTVNTLTSGHPDFFGITPNAGSGLSVGIVGVPITDVVTDLGWTSVQWEAQQNGTGTTPGRLKVGLYSSPGTGTPYAVAAGATKTIHVLHALVRNLSQSIAAAIAADIKAPGTPTTTTGSYTSFSKDERAYVFAASGNALGATLDLSPTNVTTRFKPIIKVTGWTAGQPIITWGGSTLTPNVDYRYAVDSANSTLYAQLYYDVVPSGAATGQKNNAALAITAAPPRQAPATGAFQSTNSRSAPASAAFQASLSRNAPSTGAFQSTGLTRSAPTTAAFQAAVSRNAPASAAFLATLSRSAPTTGAFQATLSRSASGTGAFQSTLARSAPTSAALSGTFSRNAPTTASFSVAGSSQRTAPTTAAFSATSSRAAPGTAAFGATATRSAPASGTFSTTATLSRSASTTAAFRATLTRSAPATAVFSVTGATLSRSAPVSATFAVAPTRSAPVSASFQATLKRSAPCSADFSGGATARIRLPGTAVSATIQRGSTVLSPGQTSAYATVLTLTLRRISGVLFQPATAKEAADVFGVQMEHGATVYADWPAGVTIPNPVKSGDMLKFADGTEYRIVDAHGFVGRYLSLMVELPD